MSPSWIDPTVTVARIRPVGDRRRAGRDVPIGRFARSAVRRSFNQVPASEPRTRVFRQSDRSANARLSRRAWVASNSSGSIFPRISGSRGETSATSHGEPAEPAGVRTESVLVLLIALEQIQGLATLVDEFLDQPGHEDDPRRQPRTGVVVGGVVQEKALAIAEPDRSGELLPLGFQEDKAKRPVGEEGVTEASEELLHARVHELA